MLCFLFLLFCLFLKSISFLFSFYYSILFHVICFLLFCLFLQSMSFMSILCHSIHACYVICFFYSVHFLSLCLLCLSHVIQYIPCYLCFKSMCFCVYLMLFNTFYVTRFIFSVCFFSLCLFMSIFCHLIHCLFVPHSLHFCFLFLSFYFCAIYNFLYLFLFSSTLSTLHDIYFCDLTVLCWIENFI